MFDRKKKKTCVEWEQYTLAQNNRELNQPRRRRQQERREFAYFTLKNSSFARFARAFLIFLTFLRRSRFFRDLFCNCVDNVSARSQIFNFVFLPLNRWCQFYSMIVGTHFASVMTLNN